MTLSSSDLQSDGDLDSIRNSCDVSGYQSSRQAANICEQLSAGECFRVPDNMADKDRRDTPEALFPDDRALFQTKDQRPDK